VVNTPPTKLFYEFGAFRLDTEKLRLLRDGEIVPLTPKAVETLRVLVAHRGRVVEREDLMNSVWGDVAVEDGNLTVTISMLRKALGEDHTGQKFIETVPRLGYKFVAEVHHAVETVPSFVVEKQTLARVVVDEELQETDLQTAQPQPRKAALVGLFSSSGSKLVTATLAVAVIVAAVGIFLVRRVNPPRKTEAAPPIKTMAVLPFALLNTNPEDEYLGLGLADALITRLSNLRQIVVRPTSSILKYKSTGEDPFNAGRTMKVDAVLEGTLQKAGDRFRITVRLISIQGGSTVWASTFDEKSTDLLAMQDSISEQVTRALSLNLSNTEKQLLTKRYTENVEAYQAYIKGRYFWNKRTREGLRRGVDYFKQALDLDPTFAPAYAGLADAYALLVFQGEFPQAHWIPQATAAATRALDLDDTLAEAHTSLGFIKLWYDWDFKGAETEYRRAIELNVNYATAHHWYGEFLVLMGRSEEATREFNLAQKTDPLSVIINVDIGKMLFFGHQSDRAIAQMHETLRLDPDFPTARLFLAMSYNQKGMTDEAVGELKQAIDMTGGVTLFRAVLAYVYAGAGRTNEATAILNELKGLLERQPVAAFQIALIYAGLGDKDQAINWLDKAFLEHDPFLVYIKVDPNFDNLRSDPRFQSLLIRMKYPMT
jgi:DNA-binding winged helix-turn-helix (wHTH) protein/TolB-like protein/Flp pilus assembly protein TadD